MKAVPSPSMDCTLVVPPCSSAMVLQMASPSPVPWDLVVKKVKQSVLFRGGNVAAGVPDGKHNVIAIGAGADLDASAGGSGVQRVDQQVHKGRGGAWITHGSAYRKSVHPLRE